MTTRSGTLYHLNQAQSSAPMESSLESVIRTLNDTLTNINAKLDHTKPKYEELYQVHPNPRRIPCQSPDYEPIPRRPTFDGNPNPKVYYDWEGEMDQYFEQFDMTEEEKFKFAKFNLIRQASQYWWNVEKQIKHRYEEPVTTWKEMKSMLREKYFPLSYYRRIIDQWSRLTQGTKSVTEYIIKFNEVIRRCLIDEPEIITISRFRAGLRDDIKCELFRWEIHYLEDAYQIARDFETYQKELLISRSKPNRNNISGHRPSPSQVPLNKPSLSIPVICKEVIHEPIENPEPKSEPIEPELKSEPIEPELKSEPMEPEHVKVVCETESPDIMDNESSERTIDQIPIEPLDNCIAEACLDQDIEMDEEESSDQLEFIKSDPIPVTAE